MNLNKRWYSANSPTTSQPGNSLQNTDEEDNAQGVASDTYSQRFPNWAGNCGDATSYFWFEKIACGSTRSFLTDRSLIHDFVQLTPTWEDIQNILDLYYTTKAPLQGRDGGVGYTFITADYHIAPVLPPKINCSCMAAMDAYASLLSVVSKTPTPGAPVTLDPEILNSGTSKIVATLRMYQDPTYSIPASSVMAMPIIVVRFYLEVSTKFTRNRITISDCTASHTEGLLNDTTALKPRLNYCDNSTFDTQYEREPNGVTHMQRLSMKKFKFQTTTDVFMQCKIRACAQQPCGICTGFGDPRRTLQQDVDLSPVEGEMFAPPVNVVVSPRDTNAMVFPDTVASGIPLYKPVSPPTLIPEWKLVNHDDLVGGTDQAWSLENDEENIEKKLAQQGLPITVKSSFTLQGLTKRWAERNQRELEITLRQTLKLEEKEALQIIEIVEEDARILSADAVYTGAWVNGRALQGGPRKKKVTVNFLVGVADRNRANIASTALAKLAAGETLGALSFKELLMETLIAAGKNDEAYQAALSEPVFSQPEVTVTHVGGTVPRKADKGIPMGVLLGAVISLVFMVMLVVFVFTQGHRYIGGQSIETVAQRGSQNYGQTTKYMAKIATMESPETEKPWAPQVAQSQQLSTMSVNRQPTPGKKGAGKDRQPTPGGKGKGKGSEGKGAMPGTMSAPMPGAMPHRPVPEQELTSRLQQTADLDIENISDIGSPEPPSPPVATQWPPAGKKGKGKERVGSQSRATSAGKGSSGGRAPQPSHQSSWDDGWGNQSPSSAW
jgi:hypothetical protein